ncbi:hypothetical protein, partial [Pelagicoccus sp. SDUM812002]|uniref:hypothetical protein n=1 Tax=Pelagicoccus sp. SDUM812002 TaxID=3041266 RepID=UPI0028107431
AFCKIMKTAFLLHVLFMSIIAHGSTLSISSAVSAGNRVFIFECGIVKDGYNQIVDHSSIILTEMKEDMKRPTFRFNADSSFTILVAEKEIKLNKKSLVVIYDHKTGSLTKISDGFTLRDSSEFFDPLAQEIQNDLRSHFEKKQNKAVDTTAANARLFRIETSKSTNPDVEAMTEAAVVSP